MFRYVFHMFLKQRLEVWWGIENLMDHSSYCSATVVLLLLYIFCFHLWWIFPTDTVFLNADYIKCIIFFNCCLLNYRVYLCYIITVWNLILQNDFEVKKKWIKKIIKPMENRLIGKHSTWQLKSGSSWTMNYWNLGEEEWYCPSVMHCSDTTPCMPGSQLQWSQWVRATAIGL